MVTEKRRQISLGEILQAGLHHQQAGRYQEAERLCGLALAAAPDHPDTLGLLAVISANTRRFEAANDYFTRAIAVAPPRADLHGNYANVLLEQGRLDEAVEQCRLALSLDPGRIAAHTVLGSALLALNRPRETVSCYREALALQPDNPEGWGRLGELLKSLGNIDEAWACFRKALELRPGNQDYAWRLATVDPVWLAPLTGKRVCLRRYQEGDAGFLHQCFLDPKFMAQYNHNIRQGQHLKELERKLRQAAKRHPCQSRTVDWLITRQNTGQAIGIANLVEIQFAHRRAEFLIGLPSQDDRATGVALEASLLVLDFAFNTVRLNKLTTIVYGSNPTAQHNALALGFVQESFLREQMLDQGSGSFIDLYGNGMTLKDFRANTRMGRLSRRLLGRDITVEALAR